jgi:hypothetical protein
MVNPIFHQLEHKNDLPRIARHISEGGASASQADERIVAVAWGFFSLEEWMTTVILISSFSESLPATDHAKASTDYRPWAPLSFTGEHVGEPRLLICLYSPPLLHVDLKFISVSDAGRRVEDPVILWERDGQLTAVLNESAAVYPAPDLQWIEERFWVWVHYGATKLGRGEVLEAHDSLAFLRSIVLGPLALLAQGARPSGVRKVETQAQPYLEDLIRTTAPYDRLACVRALQAAVTLYRKLRNQFATATFSTRPEAETAAMDYLAEIESKIAETTGRAQDTV